MKWHRSSLSQHKIDGFQSMINKGSFHPNTPISNTVTIGNWKKDDIYKYVEMSDQKLIKNEKGVKIKKIKLYEH